VVIIIKLIAFIHPFIHSFIPLTAHCCPLLRLSLPVPKAELVRQASSAAVQSPHTTTTRPANSVSVGRQVMMLLLRFLGASGVFPNP